MDDSISVKAGTFVKPSPDYVEFAEMMLEAHNSGDFVLTNYAVEQLLTAPQEYLNSFGPSPFVMSYQQALARALGEDWQGQGQGQAEGIGEDESDAKRSEVIDGASMDKKSSKKIVIQGISLTIDQWKVIREHVDEIDQAIAENA